MGARGSEGLRAMGACNGSKIRPGIQSLSHHTSQEQPWAATAPDTGTSLVMGMCWQPAGSPGSVGPMAGQGRAVGSWNQAQLQPHWDRFLQSWG